MRRLQQQYAVLAVSFVLSFAIAFMLGRQSAFEDMARPLEDALMAVEEAAVLVQETRRDMQHCRPVTVDTLQRVVIE